MATMIEIQKQIDILRNIQPKTELEQYYVHRRLAELYEQLSSLSSNLGGATLLQE